MPWTFTEDLWCSDSSMWQKNSCACKEFPFCQTRWRIQKRYRQFPNAFLICLISWEVYRKWKHNCCLLVDPLAEVKDENEIFFNITEKRTVMSLHHAMFYLPVYTYVYWGQGLLLITDCILLEASIPLTVPYNRLYLEATIVGKPVPWWVIYRCQAVDSMSSLLLFSH